MFVVAVVSQKGGSGKTTLTGHLSVQASLAGHGPVAIVDTDPQGSLAAWWNERETPEPVFVQTNLHDLRGHLDNLRQAGVKMVMVDTPPAITSAIHDVISVADYVVVPTKPSPHDLRAVGATVKLVQACNKPMVFVLNDASPRAKITFEAAIALSQHGTVAPVTIHHRTIYASSMIDGRTAMELEPNGQSATEILGLWEYLNARLNSEILPTTIGLDAMNRFNGVSTKKKAFNDIDDYSAEDLSIDAIEEAIEEAVVAKQEASRYVVASDDQASIDDYSETGQVAAPSLVSAAAPKAVKSTIPAPISGGDDLWAGFTDAEKANSKSQKRQTSGIHHHDFTTDIRVTTRTDAGH
ncbi:MAG: ParA family protein, partial [Rhodospirillaceae bacterium]|nr:ParA family protein [Rhodospirillaceae bacterium]